MTLWRSASMNSKTKQTSRLLSAGSVSWSLMMLGWSVCLRISISLQVRWASVECWKASNIFLRANILRVALSSTFHTWPQAPDPTFLMIEYLVSTWVSTFVESVCDIFQNYIQDLQIYCTKKHRPQLAPTPIINISMNLSLKSFLFLTTRNSRRLPLALPAFKFSTGYKNKENVDLVCSQITNLSNQTISNASLSNIAMLIEGIEGYERQSTISLLVTSLLKHKDPASKDLLKSEVIENLVSDQPFIRLSLVMHDLQSLSSASEPDIKKINDLYLECFDKILPMAKGSQKIKVQAMFYKSFGKHLLTNNQKQKGLSSLKKSLVEQKKLIMEEYHRFEQFNKKREAEEKEHTKDKATKEFEELRSNAMKENIRRLIQSLFETIYYVYTVRRVDFQAEADRAVVETLAMIDEYIVLCSLVSRFKNYSRNYHRLNQIRLELQFAFAIKAKNKDRKNETLRKMKDFYKESFYDLEDTAGNLEVQKQIALALMSMQRHLSRADGKPSAEIKLDLAACSKQILEKGKFESKPTQANMLKLLGDFIRANT